MTQLDGNETQRIEDLLLEMSVEEKIAQLTGTSLGGMLDGEGRLCEDKMSQFLDQGIGQITLSGGATDLPPERTAENANCIQRFLRENTRLGIPAIFNDECIAGFVGMGATHFPQAIGMGAAWSPELSERMAAIICRQARAVGSHLMYSPVFDVGVDPRWGRIEETWGEDPYLTSRIGVAFVRGLHGARLHEGVVATLKHFAGYSAPEGGRNCAPAHMGPRELREVFLLPFEAAVKEAGAESVMAAYHDIDGLPCASNRELLTDILRGEWGFQGIVIADWGVVEMLHSSHQVAAGLAEAGRLALEAGLDVETPNSACYSQLVEAVKHSNFPLEVVDQAVRRHLRVKMLLGLFCDPFVSVADAGRGHDTPAQRAVALEAARASMVLLKNDDHLLPLSRELTSLAVVGPNAARPRALLGDYSYSIYRTDLDGDAVDIVSVLEGIQRKITPGIQVRHAAGCDFMGPSKDGFGEACEAAANSDVVVVVLGGQSALHRGGTAGENLDRAELRLPGVQEELVEELHRIGKPMVVVLTNGRPLSVASLTSRASAILEAWLPGEEGGTAVADVLFGDYNPGGKLPVSILRSAGQVPRPYNVRPASLAHWANYVFTDRTPLFSFGHGLSYTEFAYRNLRVAPDRVREETAVHISLEVENVGDRQGDEVVQLYLRDPVASVTRPGKELRGFARINLEVGERKSVTFAMPVELMAFHDRHMDLVVEPGVFEVMVGSSSQDIRLEGRFELATERRPGQRTRFRTDVAVATVS